MLYRMFCLLRRSCCAHESPILFFCNEFLSADGEAITLGYPQITIAKRYTAWRTRKTFNWDAQNDSGVVPNYAPIKRA
jgi:hypothetical protein